jgi:Fe2+ transport system protein FeoA
VISVFERDRQFLKELDELGVRPGVEVDVLSSEGALALGVGGRRVNLEWSAASRVWVRPA